MIHSPQTARDAGIQLLRGGFGPLRSGTVKFVHARGAVHGTTLCGKTLSEPNAIGSKEYLGQYMLCTACQRKLNAAGELPRMSARAALTVIGDHWMPDRVPADVAPALDVLKQYVASTANLAGLLRQTLNYMDQEDNAPLWNEAWTALEAIDPELTKAPF